MVLRELWRGHRSAGRCLVTMVSALVSALSCGCSERNEPPPCPRMGAPFHLQVVASGEPLPGDTLITVRYHGNDTESYGLSSPSVARENRDVCCRAGGVAGDPLPAIACPGEVAVDAGTVDAIQCSLWTDGIAEVTIQATGYPELVETLMTRQREDDCGLETVHVTLELVKGDGGLE